MSKQRNVIDDHHTADYGFAGQLEEPPQINLVRARDRLLDEYPLGAVGFDVVYRYPLGALFANG